MSKMGPWFFFFFLPRRTHAHANNTRQYPPLCAALYSSPRSLPTHPRSRSTAGIPYHPTSYFLSANFPMCNEWIITLEVRCWDLGIPRLNSNAGYHNIINISIAIPDSGLPPPFVWNVPLLWSRAISSVLWLHSCADVWGRETGVWVWKRELASSDHCGGYYIKVHMNMVE